MCMLQRCELHTWGRADLFLATQALSLVLVSWSLEALEELLKPQSHVSSCFQSISFQVAESHMEIQEADEVEFGVLEVLEEIQRRMHTDCHKGSYMGSSTARSCQSK